MEEMYWKQFENSGRIEDYLSFRSSIYSHMTSDISYEDDYDAVKTISCQEGHTMGKGLSSPDGQRGCEGVSGFDRQF